MAGSYAPLWNVPYPRNPFFTGREEVLDELQQRLTADNAARFHIRRGSVVWGE